MATFFVASETGFDMERMNLSDYWDGMMSSPTLVEMQNHWSSDNWETLYLVGEGFTGGPGWFPGGGVVHRVVYDSSDGTFQIDGLNTPVLDFLVDFDPAAQTALRQALLAGDDTVRGQIGADRLRGYAGNDSVDGYFGGDDLHGNMGDDTVVGGPGDDWVVGGKDNDSLTGDAGADIVYGNLGSDTCDGGDGADIVRGGQENDLVLGGAGDDYVSGDRGADTVTGGAGADRFHTFGDAGLDVVTDFRTSDGDRVELDLGTNYTVSQLGGDTVINMVGGGQMVLVGVELAALPPGWIFEG